MRPVIPTLYRAKTGGSLELGGCYPISRFNKRPWLKGNKAERYSRTPNVTSDLCAHVHYTTQTHTDK